MSAIALLWGIEPISARFWPEADGQEPQLAAKSGRSQAAAFDPSISSLRHAIHSSGELNL